MTIKTAGELRGFLADVLLGIRSGDVNIEEARAIAQVAGQITHSLAVEAKTAIALKKMGESGHVPGSMQIASGDVEAITAVDRWCEQCEARVPPSGVVDCKSRFCKLRSAA